MRINFYNIYDLDGNLVKSHLKRNEVLSFCNLSKNTSLSDYYKKGNKLNGIYIYSNLKRV